jgi:transcriptional regulator with XRE-family HTH domain
MTPTQSNRLRRGREIAGLSLGQAARLLGMQATGLSLMELNGVHADDDRLLALAALYQTTVAWLLGDKPQISAENLALLGDVDYDKDRATLREFMGMLSTPERDGLPPPRKARTLAEVKADRALTVAWDTHRSDAQQEEADRRADAEQPIARKRRYVASQPQTRKHHCHWPGCDKQVPPAMWGCKAHWFRLPKALRDRVWRTYAPGQEVDMTPSEEYLQVADDVQRWIREHGGAP